MKNRNERYRILDAIRGLILISMMFYHTVWDMVYIFDVDWDWYRSLGAFYWQQSICWGFILLSGFCWPLGKRHLRRGLLVFGAGLLISLITHVFMPQNAIRFGVLTLLGSSMLLMIPLHQWLKKCNPAAGAVVAFALFWILRNINSGYIGFGMMELIKVPKSWYANWVTTFLGLPHRGFWSMDYFSILPWFLLFVTGYFLYGVAEEAKKLEKMKGIGNSVLEWLGRNCLFIYMLHQPMIYGVLFVCFGG